MNDNVFSLVLLLVMLGLLVNEASCEVVSETVFVNVNDAVLVDSVLNVLL